MNIIIVLQDGQRIPLDEATPEQVSQALAFVKKA